MRRHSKEAVPRRACSVYMWRAQRGGGAATCLQCVNAELCGAHNTHHATDPDPVHGTRIAVRYKSSSTVLPLLLGGPVLSAYYTVGLKSVYISEARGIYIKNLGQ